MKVSSSPSHQSLSHTCTIILFPFNFFTCLGSSGYPTQPYHAIQTDSVHPRQAQEQFHSNIPGSVPQNIHGQVSSSDAVPGFPSVTNFEDQSEFPSMLPGHFSVQTSHSDRQVGRESHSSASSSESSCNTQIDTYKAHIQGLTQAGTHSQQAPTVHYSQDRSHAQGNSQRGNSDDNIINRRVGGFLETLAEEAEAQERERQGRHGEQGRLPEHGGHHSWEHEREREMERFRLLHGTSTSQMFSDESFRPLPINDTYNESNGE